MGIYGGNLIPCRLERVVSNHCFSKGDDSELETGQATFFSV